MISVDIPNNILEESLSKLLRGTGQELNAYIQEVCSNKDVPDSKSISHCYHIQLDGNGRPRVKDFIEFITTKLLEYAIPRSEIEKAKNYFEKYNSPSETIKLERKAKALLTELETTGEGGELLLYILVQEFLKIPQLLCKMPLKTNSNVHYHGVDGIHVEYDTLNDVLALYWGESKLHQSIQGGITACLNSLKEYLILPNSIEAPQERDLQLIKDGLDLNDEKLETALVQYFDKDNPNFNKLQYRGVCLVGFDYDKYPKIPNQIFNKDLTPIVQEEIEKWIGTLSNNIKKHITLETFQIHIFLIPFPSVEDFRQYFLKSLI